MSVMPLEEQISSFADTVAKAMLLSGLSYKEGIITCRALLFLMEELSRDPNIDDEFLVGKVKEMVRAELKT